MNSYFSAIHSRTILTLISCFLLLQMRPEASAAQESYTSKPAVSNDQINEITLKDAINIGLYNNRIIRSSHIERAVQKFDLHVAEKLFSPKFLLTGKYISSQNSVEDTRQAQITPQTNLLLKSGARLNISLNNQNITTSNSGQVLDNGISFTAVQPLLRGFGESITTSPLQQATLNEKSNALKYKQIISETITQIIFSYRELLKAQERVQITRNSYNRSLGLLSANHAMVAAGRMAHFDVVQAEADAANQELAVEEAGNQLEASKLDLLNLLALDIYTPIRAIDSLAVNHIHIELDHALSTALGRQPAYLLQLIAKEQADIDLSVADNELLWDVSLIGGVYQSRTRQTAARENRQSRGTETYLGIQIDIPIDDLGRKQSKVHAEAAVTGQSLRVKEARQALERDVGNAVRDLTTRRRQYEISLRAHELSKQKLEIEREKLKIGRSSNFAVISFEADLRSTENARLNALIAYLNAHTSFERSIGTTLENWNVQITN